MDFHGGNKWHVSDAQPAKCQISALKHVSARPVKRKDSPFVFLTLQNNILLSSPLGATTF